ncbi:MAG: dockerin type I domain-containing protein, partial [Planctomycetota bacterium]|nr:dockerin type I domain-containing protein [Planctomycetota bacterium]
DIANLPGTPQPADFVCQRGNSSSLTTWVNALSPSVSVRPNAGQNGSSRVTLIWSDNAIQKTWLRVQIQASSRTGLAQPYVFYFGNAIGEVGDSPTNAAVTALDQLLIRNNPLASSAPIVNRYDINRDRAVNALDVMLARAHATSGTTALQLITAPSTP